MSARTRLDEADDILLKALAPPSDPSGDPDDVRLDRIEGLLHALVVMTGAHAEAVIEANEHRQLAFRVEHPGILGDPARYVGTPTRPSSGG